jgi:hypothetical protein
LFRCAHKCGEVLPPNGQSSATGPATPPERKEDSR